MFINHYKLLIYKFILYQNHHFLSNLIYLYRADNPLLLESFLLRLLDSNLTFVLKKEEYDLVLVFGSLLSIYSFLLKVFLEFNFDG